MKRLHVHIKVDDIARSTPFYTALFGRAPDKLEPDYAKWMLDDPYANVSISAHGGAPGVDHVGIQVEDAGEVARMAERLSGVGANLLDEPDATCCYARSRKVWARDPEGAIWELFHTFGDSATYGAEPDRSALQTPASACCAPGADA